jgi:hypothetical protein
VRLSAKAFVVGPDGRLLLWTQESTFRHGDAGAAAAAAGGGERVDEPFDMWD